MSTKYLYTIMGKIDDNNDTKIPEPLFVPNGDIGDKPIELISLPEQRLPTTTTIPSSSSEKR
eukprot:UN09381